MEFLNSLKPKVYKVVNGVLKNVDISRLILTIIPQLYVESLKLCNRWLYVLAK